MDGLQARALRSALFSALGLLPLACGGSTTSNEDPRSSGGASAGGTSQSRGGSTASNGGAVSSGGATNAFPCGKSASLLSEPSGYEKCANGSVHRPQVIECPNSAPRPEGVQFPTEFDTCGNDADCTEQAHGYCAGGQDGISTGSYCVYGCLKDDDCDGGNICLCGDPVGQCVPASCGSNASCAPGMRCQAYDSMPRCNLITFSCQTPSDTCGSDVDCGGDTPFCAAPNGTFECIAFGCDIGRPFLVDSLARVANVIPSNAWQSPLPDLDLSEVPAEIRAAAASSWQHTAQMEHASVAAFARFALQLLSLGAPAELLELTTRAMGDEVDHARRAFAVASHYAGTLLGPDTLKVDDSCGPVGVLEIVRLTLLEGCIGETVAALEALELSEAVTPALRDHLATVARDETRHAELAFRFLRWALANGDSAVEECVRSAIDSVRSELRTLRGSHSAPDATETALLLHGVLSDRDRQASRSRALRDVVLPCLEALLNAPPAFNPALARGDQLTRHLRTPAAATSLATRRCAH